MCISVKSKMIKIIDELHWKLEQVEFELRQKIKELDENNIKTKKIILDNRFFWFRKVVEYMSSGLTYGQSLQLLCEDEKIDSSLIKKVFEAFDYQRKATELYAKVYAVKKLKNAGFSNKKIADILEISAQTVAKLAKCKANLITNRS